MPLPSKFRFRKLDTIGAADAEEDLQYLNQCFVDTGDLQALRNCADPRRIIVGRTGSGKSALLLRLKEVESHVIEVRPESLALAYISNSNILTFFTDLGVRLDVFFKLLWRHVFAVEILKHHFHIDTEEQKKSFLVAIKDMFRDKKDEKALEYLETWGKSFWQETEYRIKEVTNKIEEDLKSTAKAQVPGLSFGAEGASKLTAEQKSDIIERAQHVVNNVQIRQLSDIIDLIDRVLSDPQKRYYIVIDRLDEDWLDDKLRYRLIRALIESVRDFGKVKCVKIALSIRLDLLQRVFKLTRDAGFQEEKYDSLYLKMNWTPSQLAELLDNRIDFLVKQRYTSQTVTHNDILPKSVQKKPSMEYILNRTFLRPRDLISFFNSCIQQAVDNPLLTPTIIQRAEHDYSRSRFRSLGDEWFADYPNLLEFAMILKGMPGNFPIADISIEHCEAFCLERAITRVEQEDTFSTGATDVVNGAMSVADFRRRMIQVFYRVGLLGLKLEPYEEFNWSHKLLRTLPAPEVSDQTKVAIHPMFYRALGIRK